MQKLLPNSSNLTLMWFWGNIDPIHNLIAAYLSHFLLNKSFGYLLDMKDFDRDIYYKKENRYLAAHKNWLTSCLCISGPVQYII